MADAGGRNGVVAEKMKILRVFPHRTTYTPTDELTFIGIPPFREMIPEHDEVHVSAVYAALPRFYRQKNRVRPRVERVRQTMATPGGNQSAYGARHRF